MTETDIKFVQQQVAALEAEGYEFVPVARDGFRARFPDGSMTLVRPNKGLVAADVLSQTGRKELADTIRHTPGVLPSTYR